MTPEQNLARVRLEFKAASIKHTDGYAMFYLDKFNGWDLNPTPDHWRPGAIAICVKTGQAKQAAGGNGCDGAERWEAMP